MNKTIWQIRSYKLTHAASPGKVNHFLEQACLLPIWPAKRRLGQRRYLRVLSAVCRALAEIDLLLLAASVCALPAVVVCDCVHVKGVLSVGSLKYI